MRHGGWQMKGSGASNRKNNNLWFYGSTVKSTSFTWAAAENFGAFAQKSGRASSLATSGT
jgi:hypothetical protein